MADKILVYPEETKNCRKEFLKRLEIEEFKKISNKQIAT